MDLSVGTELPPFVRETRMENWNRFAAVMDEFVPHHMDDDDGRKSGMPGAFGMGNLQSSYMHNLIRDWMGETGRIRHFTIQWQQPNLKNTVVTARGRITAVEETAEGKQVSLELWTEDNNDRRLANGTAKVLFSA
jgi:acyl dehydratase